MAKSSTKTASKKASGKRETIAPNGDKRYVRRDTKGQFKQSDDVSKSLSQDAKKHSKKTIKAGYGDKGDASKKSATKKSAAKRKS